MKRTDGGQLDRLVSHAGLCCAEGMCGCGCGGHQAAGSRLRRNTDLRVKSGSLLALLWEGTINGWFSCHLVTNPHLKNCPDDFDVVRPTLMAGGTFRQQSDKEPSSGERSSRPPAPHVALLRAALPSLGDKRTGVSKLAPCNRDQQTPETLQAPRCQTGTTDVCHLVDSVTKKCHPLPQVRGKLFWNIPNVEAFRIWLLLLL